MTSRPRNLSPWQWFLGRLAEVEVADPCPVEKPDELAAWRRRARRTYDRLLGPLPEPVDLDVEVLDSENCGSYRRDHIVYDTAPGMSVPAYLLVPHDRTTPGPAVLAAHGHGSGKTEVCGIDGGDPARRAEIDAHNGDYAHQLAEAGYVVLAPDHRTFGERQDWNPPNLYGCDLTHTHVTLVGDRLLTLDLWDLRRGLDLLCEHQLVDPKRVGMVGLSFGGTTTLFLAAWDRRVRAAVVSGYFSSWGVCGAVPWNMCGSQVLPGIATELDHAELGALVAPRPLLIESGTDDVLFPVEAARDEFERLAAAYAGFGAPDRVVHDVFDGGHRWHGEQAYPFLERWLGRP